jgi:hypothetical protein
MGLDRHPPPDLGSARAVDHRDPTRGDPSGANSPPAPVGSNVPKKADRNLLIATWNLREFGDLTRKWDST